MDFDDVPGPASPLDMGHRRLDERACPADAHDHVADLHVLDRDLAGGRRDHRSWREALVPVAHHLAVPCPPADLPAKPFRTLFVSLLLSTRDCPTGRAEWAR